MIALSGQRWRVLRVRLARVVLELRHPELKCARLRRHVPGRDRVLKSYRPAPATTIYAAYRVIADVRNCRRCGEEVYRHERRNALPSWPNESLKTLAIAKGEVFV